MLVADMGAVFLGTDNAKLIRTAALFPTGIGLEALAETVGSPVEETAASVSHLMDAGILWAPEVGLISLNSASAYFAGVCRLLDARTILEQTISQIATALGGPGTRVMIYGAPVTGGLRFEPDQRLVFIAPPDLDASAISVKEELSNLIEESIQSAVIGFEDDLHLAAVLQTGDPAAIRRWLNADDIREQPRPAEETLIDARRDYLVGGQHGIR